MVDCTVLDQKSGYPHQVLPLHLTKYNTRTRYSTDGTGSSQSCGPAVTYLGVVSLHCNEMI